MKSGALITLIALGVGLVLAAAPCAEAAAGALMVQKRNPLTGRMEWVRADANVLERAVGTFTKPVRRATSTLFGSDFVQNGEVPGFGGKLTQTQIETPTGYKRKVENVITGTAGWAGGVTGGKTMEIKASRAARSGVRKVLNTEATNSSTLDPTK